MSGIRQRLVEWLHSAASCTRLGHEWERWDGAFVCRYCGEPGFDASEARIAEFERRIERLQHRLEIAHGEGGK